MRRTKFRRRALTVQTRAELGFDPASGNTRTRTWIRTTANRFRTLDHTIWSFRYSGPGSARNCPRRSSCRTAPRRRQRTSTRSPGCWINLLARQAFPNSTFTAIERRRPHRYSRESNEKHFSENGMRFRIFFSAWGKQPRFTEACSDYSDLQEFESLFREHFREFVKKQIEKEIVPRRTPARGRSWEFNPFRGLEYFDFDHSPIFHGRTKVVGEVVDALNEQAIAKKPFVLILGPSGSGKTSLVRGGVLPLLTELATVMGEGPWRRVTTRPGPGSDPFDALAAALLADGALPELQEGKSRDA